MNAFGVVDERSEYDDTEHQEEDEQEQFTDACLKSLYQDFQSGRMARQFEQSHDTNDGEEFENVSIVQTGGELLQCQVEKEGKGGGEIDHVDVAKYELQFGRGAQQSNRDFDREPSVADTFDVEEGLVRVCLQFGQRPTIADRSVLVHRSDRSIHQQRNAHVRMRFQAKRQN